MSAEDFAAVRHYADRKDHVSAEANKAIIAALARLEARQRELESVEGVQNLEARIAKEYEESLEAAEAKVEALTAALRGMLDAAELILSQKSVLVPGSSSAGIVDIKDGLYALQQSLAAARAALATSEQARTEAGAK